MFETQTIVEAEGRRGQDRVVVVQHRQGIVLALADGAGGSGGGEEAAETLTTWVRAYCDRAVDIRIAAEWAALLARVDAQISAAEGETTGVIVAVFEDGLAGASVGDSAAWLVEGGRIDDLTAGQAYKPLLGTGQAKVVTFERTHFSGTLMLGSDGLVKYGPRDKLAQAAETGDLATAARALVECVRLKSGALQDDVSVILCRRNTQRESHTRHEQKIRYVLTDDGEMRTEPLTPGEA